ncbi:ExbD/TolR family protein [Marinibactrum halimedae]|uniref:Biopolymer transporter ExbD n=1 Tax=Marinibactrum halimedae TaxID=1444977 RepID=A0AA37WMJ2_9GAMM|nr:biopolymer transporter ExbD [Marinibactrum halimedae]MCD9459909.1 biopolymer transporter ExbD [Marinibactrum halimedae]GLS25236.1 biopolymer transporter ExbD [Marinibactrum halimedae]
MSRRKGRGTAEEKADIDLTPMLDVVFIMLIFFIVTASFTKEVGLGVNIPEPNDNPPPEDGMENILISVTPADEVMIDNRRVDVRSVRSIIEQKHAENPKAVVIIKADIASTAATYVAIADAAREAKVNQVSLVPDGMKK